MDKDALRQIVNRFSSKRIAVVGDVGLDKYVFGEVPKINPEMPGAPLLRKTREEYRLGCAANVARNIAAADAKPFLYAVVGKDSNGERIGALCVSQGILFYPAVDGETIVKERLVEESHQHYICRVDSGEDSLVPMGRESSDSLFEKLIANSIDAIVLSDYDKRDFRKDFGERVISYANSKGIPVIVDPKPENWRKFVGATVLTPNISEARKITGMENENPREVAARLKELTQSKYAVITLGKDGMITYDGSFHEMPTLAREVVDVVGAGDTVTSAFALALVSGASIVEAAQIANIAAGIVVEKQGTATASVEEILERIREY
jgi:D-glycero-beta-D-manno-heptose-7-phosphate kinase